MREIEKKLGYTFNDFLRVGLGMTIVGFLTLLVAMPLFWQLY